MNEAPEGTSAPYIDPKLLQVWERGSLKQLGLGPMSPELARNLRSRLYREREKMRKSNHPSLALAETATITLRKHGTGTILVVYPANLLIDAVLARAGIVAGDPPELD